MPIFSLRNSHAVPEMIPKERDCQAFWACKDNGKAFIEPILIFLFNQSQNIRIYKPIAE